MANRFTDTELWDRPWFMDLSPKIKCLVQYFWAKCDNSGVLRPNWKLISVQIGEDVSIDDLLAIDDGKQFKKLEGGKVWSIKFVKFQTKGRALSPKSKPHQQIVNLLEEHGLLEEFADRFPKIVYSLSIPLAKGIKNENIDYVENKSTLSKTFDRVQDKDKDKDKDRGGLGETYPLEEFREFTRLNTQWREEFLQDVQRRFKRQMAIKEFEELADNFIAACRASEQRGWPSEAKAKAHFYHSSMLRLEKSGGASLSVASGGMTAGEPRNTNWKEKLVV